MNQSFLIFGIFCYSFLGVFIYVQNKHKHVFATIFKTLASLCFFLLALYQIFYFKNIKGINVDANKVLHIYIALAFGLIGDFLLNFRDLFKNPIKKYLTLSGVISFFVGHIFYLIHLFSIMNLQEFSFIDKSKLYIPILASLLLIFIFIILIFKFIKKKKDTQIVAIIYISIVSLLTSISLFNMLSFFFLGNKISSFQNYFILMFVACFLFSASDVILIFNSYGNHPSPLISGINLFIYYTAQLLMGVSIFFFFQASI